MTQEIESVKAAISVVIDDGDFIINSTGPIGKAMSQAILPLVASAKRVTIITDGEMRVMKRNGKGADVASVQSKRPASSMAELTTAGNGVADVQDEFVEQLESGATGEAAMGESPSPTPGPSDPVAVPTKAPARRKPQIFQDAAAPPAPELAVEEMERLLEEAAQGERDAVKAAEDLRFQRQQAVQAGAEATDIDPATAEAPAKPRKREPRNLATAGKSCGRCGGGGQIMGDSGHTGACPVCMGSGQIKSWVRSR